MDFPTSQIRLPAQPVAACFSPSEAGLLALGLINGVVRLYTVSGLTASKLRSTRSHAESSRAVCFSSDGQTVLSASADASILACDVESGKPMARIRHTTAVDQLVSVSATQFAAADESGQVQLWDTRQEQPACAVQMHRDYVSALVLDPHSKHLLSSSGDGNLGVMDLRTHKNLAGPNGDPDDELLSLALVKHGTHVICGTQSGSLNIFKRGAWDDPARKMTGCPSSMDALVSFDEDTLIAGSQDGLIRLLSIQPDKVIGALPDPDELPIESLALSGKQASGTRLLASIGHAHHLDLHDLAALEAEDSDPEAEPEAGNEAAPLQAPASPQGDEAERSGSPQKKRRKKGGKKAKQRGAPPNMFQDLL